MFINKMLKKGENIRKVKINIKKSEKSLKEIKIGNKNSVNRKVINCEKRS